jgi:predicted SAM-dependent methyltransferase
LESFPWPFESDSVDEIQMSHVLEHLGQSPQIYLEVIQELYRICRTGATITIHVPHPRHDSYLCDPTHVRPILPESFQLFNKAQNEEWIKNGKSNTPLALQLGVDFEVKRVNYQLEDRWSEALKAGEVLTIEVQEAMETQYNVVKQITIELEVLKQEVATQPKLASA